MFPTFFLRIAFIFVRFTVNLYHSMNQIRLVMILTMMSLTPGLLVRALFLFTLINLMVVLDTSLVVLDHLLVM